MPSNLVGKIKLFFSFLRLILCFLFYPGYVKYYELDSSFRRNTPYLIYSLIGAKRGYLLDIGCGDGDTFDLLPSSVFPIGVEISRTRTKRIKKHAHAILADAQNLPIRNGTMNFAVASEILEHLPNPSRCLHELCRVLKPEGALGIIIPNDKVFMLYRLTSLKEFWKIIAYRYQHLSHFNLTEFLALCDEWFTIVKIFLEKRKWKMLRIFNRTDTFHWYIIAKKKSI